MNPVIYEGLSAGAITGIVIAAVFLLVLLIIVFSCIRVVRQTDK